MEWKYVSNAYSCQQATYTCVGLEGGLNGFVKWKPHLNPNQIKDIDEPSPVYPIIGKTGALFSSYLPKNTSLQCFIDEKATFI